MAEEITLERLQIMAAHAGLSLSDEELQRLLAGVSRSQLQANLLRGLLSDNTEPAFIFAVSETSKQ